MEKALKLAIATSFLYNFGAGMFGPIYAIFVEQIAEWGDWRAGKQIILGLSALAGAFVAAYLLVKDKY